MVMTPDVPTITRKKYVTSVVSGDGLQQYINQRSEEGWTLCHNGILIVARRLDDMQPSEPGGNPYVFERATALLVVMEREVTEEVKPSESE